MIVSFKALLIVKYEPQYYCFFLSNDSSSCLVWFQNTKMVITKILKLRFQKGNSQSDEFAFATSIFYIQFMVRQQ